MSRRGTRVHRWGSLLGGASVLALMAIVAAGPARAAAPTSTAPASSSPAASGSQATDIATVGRSLAADPLYVSTAPGTADVAAGDVRGALPPEVYVAVLPASAARQVKGEAAAVPGALLGALQRPGTVLALVGNDLEAASRVQRFDRLQQVLDDARQRLAAGSATTALVVAARDLTGSGQLSDPPSATRAGSPTGGGVLWVVLAVLAVAILAVPLLLRRSRRPKTPPPRVLRDRVEVDAHGRVT